MPTIRRACRAVITGGARPSNQGADKRDLAARWTLANEWIRGAPASVSGGWRHHGGLSVESGRKAIGWPVWSGPDRAVVLATPHRTAPCRPPLLPSSELGCARGLRVNAASGFM